MNPYVALLCLTLLHALVDSCALLTAPLWPGLENRFALGGIGLSIAFIVQSMPTSVTQAVFGAIRDRRSIPSILLIGPILAALFLTSIGHASHTSVLFLFLILGGLGIGAFHPEAAVAAGRLIPEHRARSLSFFMFGGSLGLAIGPTMSGLITSWGGMESLVYLMPPLVIAIVVMNRLGRFHQAVSASESTNATHAPQSSKKAAIALALAVLAVCSLRVVPNMAMDKVLSFVLKQRGFDPSWIGLTQSCFLISASAGMICMAVWFRNGWERTFMIWCPILSIPLLYAMGTASCPNWLLIAALVPGGMVMWGTTPAMVSYAQRLFPRGVGVASAITMGLSWGVGGLIQAPLTAYFQSIGEPQRAFWAFTPCLVVSALGATMLPKLQQEEGVAKSAADPIVEQDSLSIGELAPQPAKG